MAAAATAHASSTVSANTVTQSNDRHAGTTPRVLSAPRVGLSPTTLLNPAGTRPEPAVSVPSAKLTWPTATDTPDPELEPPGIMRASNGFVGVPYGERAPTSPVASWSRFTLPTKMAPASTRRCTTGAEAEGTYARSGHATVVGTPPTSMLSLTAKGMPKSGEAWPASRRAAARSTAACRSAARVDVEPHVPDALPIALDAGEHLVDDFVRRAGARAVGRPERLEGQAELFERHAPSLAREPVAFATKDTRGDRECGAPRRDSEC